MLHFKFAIGVERRGRVSVNRDRIKMPIAGLFPGKHDAIVGGPEDLFVAVDSREDAAGAFRGAPQFMARAGFGIRQTNRPGLAASYGTEAEGARGGSRPDKRDLTTVRRPNRIEVAIHRGVNIVQRFRTKIVNA